jgi:Xaa-Pro aminopeptidase
MARLRESLAGAGVDRLLVTNPKDVAWLTGFLGGESYLFVGGPEAVMLSDFRFQEELEPVRAAGLARVVIRTGPMAEAVGELLASERATRIGIQAEHLTVAMRRSIVGAFPGGEKRLCDTTGLVAALRAIKDETEVALIRRAVRVQEEALRAVLPSIVPGIREQEIAAALEAEMKRRGSSEPGFPTIVAAGANASLPHYRAGPARVAANRPVLIDWGAVVQGYHSDMTRVFTLGRWPAKIREIYGIVLEAHLAAAAALAPGRTTREVDAVARDLIARAGYGEQFGHGLGHGLGLDGHEDPRLTHMLPPVPLRAGMVVTIEPGIYLPGVGGVRLEDDYLITATGATNLCALSKAPDGEGGAVLEGKR